MPIRCASAEAKPGIFCSKRRNPFLSASATKPARYLAKKPPKRQDGSSSIRFRGCSCHQENPRAAGPGHGTFHPPPANARSSQCLRKANPASGVSPPKSSTRTLTTTALLAYGPSRREILMPFVTTPPGEALQPMTCPPGHMQKL